ncbi:hypothetical protein PSACC_00416 [Paramicrosporidium saccamoebae]|uniref:Uncharacterized protein n=1 Tax=Paramicrosporidium saccamoebae TaxID=1246581 RepID=A0A2H9TPU5_9FUNG|nr:hypothetical protein PSACC_00416 [Paramicrosporidium saccamoebae]
MDLGEALLPAYRRLSDFFSTKGDAPLTSAEVTVCLEWLRDATVKSAPVFATPVPIPRSIRKPAPKAIDMTPVKRQIRELLRREETVIETKGTAMDEVDKVEKAPAKLPVAMTRTAKTILDALDNPVRQIPEENTPIIDIIPLNKPVGTSQTQFEDPMPVEDDSVSMEDSPTLPSFEFRWDDSTDIRRMGYSVPASELPQFHFN